jgi:hypothetical protein
MGMDVFGKEPSPKMVKNKDGDDVRVGEYFRNTVWWWRPLATYCLTMAPHVSARCEYWHSNDGDGLDAAKSKELAAILREELSSGRTKAYAEIRQAEIKATPTTPCVVCDGTGSCAAPASGAGEWFDENGKQKYCNECDGTGRQKTADRLYPFSEENVESWAAFLENCGGFEIH